MFIPQPTDDGSYTFFSEEFQELFHSYFGAKLEAEQKFIIPCQLQEKAKHQDTLHLLDICYGLGYNSAAALAGIWSSNPDCSIELIALEADQKVPEQAVTSELLQTWPLPIPNYLATLAQNYQIKFPKLTATLLIGDARKTIQTVKNSGFQADAIFLDPFSPPKCPQLWTVEFLKLVSDCLHPQGYLATYSSAAAVRTALQLAGLNISPTTGIGRRSPGTLASFHRQALQPLSSQEQEHLQTRAALPYRDLSLQDCPRLIQQRRQAEQLESPLEPTSRWKKRWTKLMLNSQ